MDPDARAVHHVALIGGGRAGRALAGALEAAGLAVERASGRGPFPAPRVDAWVVAVRDEALGDVAAALVAAGRVGAGAVALHCSGATPAREALAAASTAGAAVGTWHPLRSLRGDERELAGTTFALEGDDAACAVAGSLTRALGGEALRLDAAALPRWHAAASLAAQGAVGLLAGAAALLEGLGLPRARAERALGALAAGAIDNARRLGVAQGLTGPVARGDAAVVARHRAALAGTGALEEAYRATALLALEAARAGGTTAPAELARVAAALRRRGGGAPRSRARRR